MPPCKACGARKPEKNGHLWGCGTTKKVDPRKSKAKEKN